MANSRTNPFNLFRRLVGPKSQSDPISTYPKSTSAEGTAAATAAADAEPQSEYPINIFTESSTNPNNEKHNGTYSNVDLDSTASGNAMPQQQQQQQHQQQQHPHLHLPHLGHHPQLPPGESGRSGFHPFHFLHVCLMSTSVISMAVNLLWPFVPAAIVTHFVIPERHTTVFALNYLGIIPAANLIGFAGSELARKLPHVPGLILETTLGSVVEIILFMVLIKTGEGNKNVPVIKAAILGSILANLLLCLGACFVAGGFLRTEQTFHEVVSETCNGLMLLACTCLVAPAAYATIFGSQPMNADDGLFTNPHVQDLMNSVSRSTAILLLITYGVFMVFQLSSHQSLYKEVFESDERADIQHRAHLLKKKLTMTECIIALVLAIALVSLCAIFLVAEIEPLVAEKNISDSFMGLILVPLVEKAAEHLTAIDEAHDNRANLALSHVMGASVQTALLNTPLVVIVGWGIGKNMDLNFRQFEAIILILAILLVGNFLRDGKSNYLEGMLCIIVYVVIAVASWYFPNVDTLAEFASQTGGNGTGTGVVDMIMSEL